MGLDEQPLNAVVDQVGNSADPRRHDGESGIHVLHHRQRAALGVGAQHRDVARPQEVGDVGTQAEQLDRGRPIELGLRIDRDADGGGLALLDGAHLDLHRQKRRGDFQIGQVMDILLAADAQAVNGVLYNGNTARRNMANNVFSAINQAGGI